MIALLIYLLMMLVILYVVKLIADMALPEPIRIVVLLIAGLVCLLWILQRMGIGV